MLREALQGADYVFHIAGVTKAKKQRQYHDGNVLSTRNLLEAASKISTIKKFCYVSSMTAIGPSHDGTPLTEDAPAHPITAYGVSKLEAETVCELYSSRIPIVILRPPAVYGPRDQDLLDIFRWVKRGFKPVFGSDKKRLSVIYGPELARAIVEATIAERTRGETYFVADATAYRFNDVMDQLAALFGRRKTISVRFPAPLFYSIAGIAELVSLFGTGPATLNIEKARDLLQMNWVCSPQKLEEHIGFRSQMPIKEGLEATIKWYEKFGWL
jgi:dihydroflavonol-4-reductase